MNAFEIIANISAILGIIGFFPLIFGLTRYIQYTYGIKKRRIKVIHNNSRFTNAALIIGIGSRASIEVPAKKYIANNEELKNSIKEEHIFCLRFVEDISNEEAKATAQIEKIVNEIVAYDKELKENGVQRLHLFYSGPSSIAAMIGAELSNRYVVLCYQLASNMGGETPIGSYVCWGSMQR